MVVSFTSNIGLAKPDDTEIAKNWVELTQLMDDNNTIIETETNLPVASYVPLIGATTTPPSVGTGSSRGEYQDFNGIVTGTFNVEFLTGFTAGSGEFAVSLPFVVDNSFHFVAPAFNSVPGQYSVVGEGYYYDSSNVAVSGHLALDVATVGGVSYVRMLTELFTTPAKGSRFVTSAMPTPIALGDSWSGSFIFKRI